MISRRVLAAAFAAAPALACARPAAARALPPPRKAGGLPLMRALARRRSTRAYSGQPLSDQTLSDLLWAAFGVNRASGGRTAPSWHGLMAIEVYAAMADGVWRYDPAAHALARHLPDDLRALSGTQPFVGQAPLDLIYVAHGERMTGIAPELQRLYAGADTGFIGQNVYLFCASEGLGSVFRAAIDHPRLERALRLPKGQFVSFAQTVGRPAA